jgi:hypothetical protein
MRDAITGYPAKWLEDGSPDGVGLAGCPDSLPDSANTFPATT